jgi:predicted nucleotidyltransferase
VGIRGLDISTAAIHKEVQRLEEAGLIVSERQGKSRLVSANEASPFASELRSLLVRAFGPSGLLQRELATLEGIDRAFIYGSWARSEHGQPGQPNDIDVMVIGTPDLPALFERARAVENRIGHQIHVTVLTQAEWDADDTGFLHTVRNGPIVWLRPGTGTSLSTQHHRQRK